AISGCPVVTSEKSEVWSPSEGRYRGPAGPSVHDRPTANQKVPRPRGRTGRGTLHQGHSNRSASSNRERGTAIAVTRPISMRSSVQTLPRIDRTGRRNRGKTALQCI